MVKEALGVKQGEITRAPLLASFSIREYRIDIVLNNIIKTIGYIKLLIVVTHQS
jgi:hypothetical protein